MIKDQHTQESVTLLAVDSSTASLAVAIVKDGVTLDSSLSFTERNHSVRIITEIEELLLRNGLRGQDVDGIAVGQGPGSYTGVRIAVTAAKTLAWAWRKPLIGVSSLEALAFGAWQTIRESESAVENAWIVPLMDARRGQVYTSRFEANAGGQWERTNRDGIRLIADWASKLEEQAEQKVWLVGDVTPYEATIERMEQMVTHLRTYSCDLNAGAVGLLAERRFRMGERDDVHTFIPNYTQVTEAEAKLQSATRGE